MKIIHNLPSKFNVSLRTVRSRILRGNITLPIDHKPGPATPLTALEKNLVEIAILMAKSRIPLSSGQGLLMINSESLFEKA